LEKMPIRTKNLPFTPKTKREAFLKSLNTCVIYNKEYCIIACPMCAKPMFLGDNKHISGKLNLRKEAEVLEYCVKVGCRVSKNNYIEFDHRKPKSKGGNSSLENCITICKKCNGRCLNKVTEYQKYIMINSIGPMEIDTSHLDEKNKILVEKKHYSLYQMITKEKEDNYLKYMEIFRNSSDTMDDEDYSMEEDE